MHLAALLWCWETRVASDLCRALSFIESKLEKRETTSAVKVNDNRKEEINNDRKRCNDKENGRYKNWEGNKLGSTDKGSQGGLTKSQEDGSQVLAVQVTLTETQDRPSITL